MIPNPIRKVLSTMAAHQVRALLMGGQACVFYGAAEFSRDTDLAVLAEPENLERLRSALAELEADCIAVPPYDFDYLRRGHALHFRCRHPNAAGMRVDIMSVLRGVRPFPELWAGRVTLSEPGGSTYELLSLPDLVQAKKTQRDKDWPMLRRLLEADYLAARHNATSGQMEFWFRELRTPELLIELAERAPAIAERRRKDRPLLAHAIARRALELAQALEAEERQEREADRLYWQPLRKELECMRRQYR